MAEAQAAVRKASGLVAEAIGALAALGPDAPANVREALSSLGMAYTALGWADPNVPYSIEREGENGGARL